MLRGSCFFSRAIRIFEQVPQKSADPGSKLPIQQPILSMLSKYSKLALKSAFLTLNQLLFWRSFETVEKSRKFFPAERFFVQKYFFYIFPAERFFLLKVFFLRISTRFWAFFKKSQKLRGNCKHNFTLNENSKWTK